MYVFGIYLETMKTFFLFKEAEECLLLDSGAISDSLCCSKVRRFPGFRGAGSWAKLRAISTNKRMCIRS